MEVKKAEHRNGLVWLLYDNGRTLKLTEEEYDAFLDFAVDRFDQTLSRLRETLENWRQ